MNSLPILGILMLDTAFERIEGDVGCPQTWPVPVRIEVVQGASPQEIVLRARPAWLNPFIDAGLRLIERGATVITSTCGFLLPFQAELARALPVPVAVSALLSVPGLQAAGAQVGILTIHAARLAAGTLLQDAGIHPDTPIEGIATDSHFAHIFLGNNRGLDPARAQADVVDAARRLVERAPKLTHLVLECANMPPYRDAVAAATGRRVIDHRAIVQPLLGL